MNKESRLFISLLSLVVLFALPSQLGATIIYIDNSASGANNGSNWTDAYLSLQDGLTSASSGDSLVVANGIYTPHASDRTTFFNLKQGVVMLGGFNGSETDFSVDALSFRDYSLNETILSGDLNADDSDFSNTSENSYHVLFAECLSSSIDTTTLIDGFTISGGNANYFFGTDYDDLRGGGIFLEANAPFTCSPKFKNVIVEENTAQFGGGISIVSFNNGAICNPAFENFIVQNNKSIQTDTTQVNSAGGISINTIDGESSPVFTNGEILKNTVVERKFMGTGGGVDLSASIFASTSVCSPEFFSVLFCGNLASGGGSHIHTYAQGGGSTVIPVFTNITLGGGVNSVPIYNRNSGGVSAVNTPVFTNALIYTSYSQAVFNTPAPSILGPNPTFSYSNVQGATTSGSWSTGFGVDGGNNIDQPAVFFDSASCDLRLYDNSPELGAGNGPDGDNMGYYQGNGLIYLDIEEALDINDCNNDTLHAFKLGIRDEMADNATYNLVKSAGNLIPEYITDEIINDSLNLTIRVPSGWYGSDTISVYFSNTVGEKDSTSFIFNLSRRPVITGSQIGVFDPSDSTFLIYVDVDTLVSNANYLFDGVVAVHNYIFGAKAGMHYAQIEKAGCFSDSAYFDLPEYINEVPLAINYFEDTSRVVLCEGDTTIRFEFNIIDDNVDQVEWVFNYYYQKIIPDSNITLSETDSSYIFEVEVPDTSGQYRLHIHAENIFSERANLYYDIEIINKPIIDSVMIAEYAFDTCVYPYVTNIDYWYTLSVYIDTFDVTEIFEVCGLETGEHTLIAYTDICPSLPHLFYIEPIIDTSGSAGTWVFDKTLNNRITVYPQPANNSIQISGINTTYALKIVDMTGKLQAKFEGLEEDDTIDITDIKAGVYILLIKTKDSYVTRRFIKK